LMARRYAVSQAQGAELAQDIILRMQAYKLINI
jgi:hypothetical protein